MTKTFAVILCLIFAVCASGATYYGVHDGGTYATGATWSTVATKSTDRVPNGATPTASDDLILDDYSGNITMGASGAAKSLNCTSNGNYAGTFAMGSRTLTVSGNVTLSPSMTLTGATSTLAMNLNGGVLTSNGIHIPNSLSTVYGIGMVLGSDLIVDGTITLSSGQPISGSYNVICSRFVWSSTFTFTAGKTLTVTTSILSVNSTSSGPTMKSDTASSPFSLVYQGTLANQTMAGVIFTDVDASGSSVPIQNWKGGTLTRTTNIVNYGSADLATAGFPPASKVYAGTDRGDGTVGTLHASNIATAAGSGSNLTAGDLKQGVTVDDVTGTAKPPTRVY